MPCFYCSIEVLIRDNTCTNVVVDTPELIILSVDCGVLYVCMVVERDGVQAGFPSLREELEASCNLLLTTSESLNRIKSTRFMHLPYIYIPKGKISVDKVRSLSSHRSCALQNSRRLSHPPPSSTHACTSAKALCEPFSSTDRLHHRHSPMQTMIA